MSAMRSAAKRASIAPAPQQALHAVRHVVVQLVGLGQEGGLLGVEALAGHLHLRQQRDRQRQGTSQVVAPFAQHTARARLGDPGFVHRRDERRRAERAGRTPARQVQRHHGPAHRVRQHEERPAPAGLLAALLHDADELLQVLHQVVELVHMAQRGLLGVVDQPRREALTAMVVDVNRPAVLHQVVDELLVHRQPLGEAGHDDDGAAPLLAVRVAAVVDAHRRAAAPDRHAEEGADRQPRMAARGGLDGLPVLPLEARLAGQLPGPARRLGQGGESQGGGRQGGGWLSGAVGAGICGMRRGTGQRQAECQAECQAERQREVPGGGRHRSHRLSRGTAAPHPCAPSA